MPRTGFFSVSLAAHERAAESQGEAEGYVDDFVRESRWHPGKIGIFAGALAYTKYGFFTRWVMRQIARRKGSGDLDSSRDYVYTDWRAVRRFALEYLETFAAAATPSGGRMEP